MASQWTHIRIKRQTHSRLVAEILKLIEAVENGQTEAPEGLNLEQINPLCPGLSADAMLTILLNARNGHRTRRRKAKLASRKPAPDADNQQ